MNFDKTTADDFSIIKNGIDNNIEIIRHDETEFYNITKIATLVNKLNSKSFEPPGIPGGSKKSAYHWFENKSTKELIETCKEQIQSDIVLYELAKGTPKQYAGTYVHRYLYDQFMSWLDPKYAIRVSIILDSIHKEANKKVMKVKDDKIDELIKETKNQSNKIDTLVEENRQQREEHKRQMAELMGHTIDVKDELKQTTIEITKLRNTTEDLSNMLKVIVPSWLGSSVLKTMLDKFEYEYNKKKQRLEQSNSKTTSLVKPIRHMKIAFICGFCYGNKMKVYFCCTNLHNVSNRIHTLSDRHSKDMYMMRPRAISLASCDINIELATIRGKEFTDVKAKMDGKTKAFDITLAENVKKRDAYDSIVSQLTESRLQIYQTQRDKVVLEKNLNTNTNIIKYITTSDAEFFDKTRPLCQKYLNCFIARHVHKETGKFIKYKYERASPRTTKRTDLGDISLSQSAYILMLIENIINGSADIDAFNEMVKNGEFTEEDISVMEAIVETEQAKISA